METGLQPKTVRLNVQISLELKERLSYLSSFQGKKVSTLVRKSIEEKLRQIDDQIFEEKMKRAYQGLAQENTQKKSHLIPSALLSRKRVASKKILSSIYLRLERSIRTV